MQLSEDIASSSDSEAYELTMGPAHTTCDLGTVRKCLSYGNSELSYICLYRSR